MEMWDHEALEFLDFSVASEVAPRTTGTTISLIKLIFMGLHCLYLSLSLNPE